MGSSDGPLGSPAFIRRYNAERLHSGIGYVTPLDRLEGRHIQIFAERDRKLDAARQRRAQLRELARQQTRVV